MKASQECRVYSLIRILRILFHEHSSISLYPKIAPSSLPKSPAMSTLFHHSPPCPAAHGFCTSLFPPPTLPHHPISPFPRKNLLHACMSAWNHGPQSRSLIRRSDFCGVCQASLRKDKRR